MSDKYPATPSVTVSRSEEPKTTPVSGEEWQDVKIDLSREQIADLKKLGVDTDTIVIRTFDLKNLQDLVRN